MPDRAAPTTSVRARLHLAADTPSEAALGVAVARRPGVRVLTESLRVDGPDGAVGATALEAGGGTLLHGLTLPAGRTTVEYAATVRVERRRAQPLTPLERWELTRPSRYCPADLLGTLAAREFGAVPRERLPAAVAAWVHGALEYAPGSSSPADTAVDTLVARRGVCRDFAHLTAALLRALDVPARVCAVYAPGLAPMDLHAVVEAAPVDAWEVVDATRLAPRQGLVRITGGRDAADTAFLTTSGPVRLEALEVLAAVDGGPPGDDLAPGAVLP
ncbi:transglutaminase family protein [Kineococcus sp. TRM81007]|uniref:transglutaminase-like domain-containing protein n=1 Tax=Kineococcus sp. TRM81007 TaxID=2925831 RepID=UPI001F572F8B|nr:transglutaminase family protein [Kineococcus sp. TRM81007]MCI2240338.1 transglutaminase family protein [Kineococcus sp. TRM81007]